jgi:hypothetical protein
MDMPNADVILWSSDLVNFHVQRLILKMSSPFFNDLFSLPQPPGHEAVNGLPVVQLSEDAEVLNSEPMMHTLSIVIGRAHMTIYQVSQESPCGPIEGR